MKITVGLIVGIMLCVVSMSQEDLTNTRKQVDSIKQTYIHQLEALKKTYSLKNNDKAVAIIQDYLNEVSVSVPVPGIVDNSDIVGQWFIRYDTGFKSLLVIRDDGTAKTDINLTWSIKDKKIVFIGENGEIDTFRLPLKDKATGDSTKCKHVYISKMKE